MAKEKPLDANEGRWAEAEGYLRRADRKVRLARDETIAVQGALDSKKNALRLIADAKALLAQAETRIEAIQ